MTSTVLIVDDCRTNRTLLREMLAELPFRFVEAADGIEALRLAREHRPDLIIMDVEMPRLDGLSATRHLRRDAQCAGVRVLVFSGDGSEECRSTARQAGCDGFLAKPVHRLDLLGEVRRLLGEPPR